MQVHTLLTEKQKKEITEAAEYCNLSVSSFLKMAAKEKINRMGIKINTVQSLNLENPGATHQPVKAEELQCKNTHQNA